MIVNEIITEPIQANGVDKLFDCHLTIDVINRFDNGDNHIAIRTHTTYKFIPEVFEWLEENFGSNGDRWSNCSKNLHDPTSSTLYMDQDVAVAFKLHWLIN